MDEAYREFSDDDAKCTAMSLVRSGKNVMVFRTFAKVHGLAAMPFGYAATPRALAEYLRKQGLGFSRDQNRLALTAASASLRDTALIVRVHAAVTAKRVKWNTALDGLKLRPTDSQANFISFDAGRSQTEVAKALLTDGVVVGRHHHPTIHGCASPSVFPRKTRARKRRCQKRSAPRARAAAR